jgi:hypothetical protein
VNDVCFDTASAVFEVRVTTSPCFGRGFGTTANDPSAPALPTPIVFPAAFSTITLDPGSANPVTIDWLVGLTTGAEGVASAAARTDAAPSVAGEAFETSAPITDNPEATMTPAVIRATSFVMVRDRLRYSFMGSSFRAPGSRPARACGVQTIPNINEETKPYGHQ